MPFRQALLSIFCACPVFAINKSSQTLPPSYIVVHTCIHTCIHTCTHTILSAQGCSGCLLERVQNAHGQPEQRKPLIGRSAAA